MTKKIKRLWIAALRSGDYQQGFVHLERDNKFCCLGVLCSVANLGPSYPNVKKILGPKADDKFTEKLWQKNDRKRQSFAQIATYIQRYM